MTNQQVLNYILFGAFLYFVTPEFIKLLRTIGFYKTKDTEGVDVTNRNPLWYKHLEETLSTPSSYGILLLPLFVFLIARDITIWYISVAFVGMWALGLWDDIVKYFLFKKKGAWGISMLQKLILQFFIVTMVVVVSGIYTESFILTAMIVFAIVFFVNSYNITDGLDGLVASLTLLILPVLYLNESRSFGNNVYLELYAVLFVFMLIFYVFNKKPAKVWLGDTGAMGLGFLLSLALLRYNFFITLLLFLPILLEGASSLVQIISIRVFHKKLFKIAPLHFHLLNSGWSEKKIVNFAFLIQLVCSVFTLLLIL